MIRSTNPLALAVLGVVALAGPLFAQEKPALQALELAIADQSTPIYGVGGVNDKRGNPQTWIELEATFALQGPVKYVDEVTIRWFVGMVDEQNQPIVLPVEVKYPDVPVGQELHAAVYVSPRSISRITGKDRVMVNQVTAYGAEVRVGSEILGAADQGQAYSAAEAAEAWWMNPQFGKRDGVLRPRNETPFAPLWSDYYLEEASRAL